VCVLHNDDLSFWPHSLAPGAVLLELHFMPATCPFLTLLLPGPPLVFVVILLLLRVDIGDARSCLFVLLSFIRIVIIINHIA